MRNKVKPLPETIHCIKGHSIFIRPKKKTFGTTIQSNLLYAIQSRTIKSQITIWLEGTKSLPMYVYNTTERTYEWQSVSRKVKLKDVKIL